MAHGVIGWEGEVQSSYDFLGEDSFLVTPHESYHNIFIIFYIVLLFVLLYIQVSLEGGLVSLNINLFYFTLSIKEIWMEGAYIVWEIVGYTTNNFTNI